MPEMCPLVTVIVPVRNEAPIIQRALDAVLAQNYPADCLEVEVIDGLSTDTTASQVRSVAARDGRVRLFSNPGRIQACGFNIGLRAARGEIIVRVDGHTVIAPDYVRRCVEHLRVTGAACVGGPLRYTGITSMGRAIESAYRSPFCVPSRYRISREAGYADTVYLGAWPRRIFDEVGFFNEALSINEDYEFNYRVRKAGGRIYLSPDIYSCYYGRQTLGALWRQFFRYGRSKPRVLARYPASIRPRQVVPPLFVAALIGGAGLAPFSRRIARLWRWMLIIYATANLGASIQQARRDGWGRLPRLPAVFTCIHLSWGGGFLLETVRLLWQVLARRHE